MQEQKNPSTQLLFFPVPGSDKMELGQDYVFHVDGLEIWIPKGYRWNGASVPKFLWSIFGGRFEPDRLEASLKHDWVYLNHSVGRAASDRQFLLDLLEANMATAKAVAMHQAVRIFGASHWPTSAEDQREINSLRTMLEERADRDRFTKLMLVA
jgi:hypothetical protein